MHKYLLPLFLLLSLLLVGSAPAQFVNHSCSHFASQEDAQAYYDGKGYGPGNDPEFLDADRDGKPCELLPSREEAPDPAPPSGESSSAKEGDKPGCKRTRRTVYITLSASKHRNVLAHAREALRLGFGKRVGRSPYPVWTINRRGASQRRSDLLDGSAGREVRVSMGWPAGGIPTKPGFDRDEIAPAFARKTIKAHVAYVPSSENRSAGAIMGARARPYCSGTKIRYAGK